MKSIHQHLIALLCLLSAGMGVAAQDNPVPVASEIVIGVGQQYRMFTKTYNQAMKDYLATHPRLAFEYQTADGNIVESGGTWFRGVKEGQTTVRLFFTGVQAGSYDLPDGNNILGYEDFTVIVKPADQVEHHFPPIVHDWGASKSGVINLQTNTYGFTLFTEDYAMMHPQGVSADDLPYFDCFCTDNYEVPLSLHYYEYNQLYESFYFFTNWELAYEPRVSPFCRYMEENGFEHYGTVVDEDTGTSGLWAYYHPVKKTLATPNFIVVQTHYYLYIDFEEFEDADYESNGLLLPKSQAREVSARWEGNQVVVSTGGHEGEPVSIVALNGRRLGQGTVQNGQCRIDGIQSQQPVIVRVGQKQSLKLAR